ncbi:hypothetical protein CsatA_019431 [Cannabis sativa]
MTSGPHLPRRSPLTHDSLSLCASHPQSISLLGFFILGSQLHTFHLLFEVGNIAGKHYKNYYEKFGVKLGWDEKFM